MYICNMEINKTLANAKSENSVKTDMNRQISPVSSIRKDS